MRFFLCLAWSVALALVSAAGVAQPAADPLQRIERIVVIFEENRSFDHLFGPFPGADGLANAGAAARQKKPDGVPYETLPPVLETYPGPPALDPRFPAGLPNAPFLIDRFVPTSKPTPSPVHEFYREQAEINGGAMDRFVAATDTGGLVMGYHDIHDMNLWRLAREFALADRMFHSAFGGSFLNHAWLVCSCAFRWPGAPPDLVATLDAQGKLVKDGDVTPDGFAVNTTRSVQFHKPRDTDPTRLVPVQTMPHIGDRMDAAGVSWAWYAGGLDDALAGKPDPLFQHHHLPFAYFADLAPGTPAQKAHLRDYKDLLRDIDSNTLPQVTFYKPIGQFDMHAGYASVAAGDAHLGELVGRLQASPAYRNMLIIVTFDENGGWWDHVAPPRRDRFGPGTRVPLIAIGPMVKRGFVDHTPYDFGSILRTIQLRFGVQPVNEVDAAATPLRGMLQ